MGQEDSTEGKRLRARRSRLVPLVVAVVACLLVVRLALVAARTETGWETLVSQWRYGATSWIGWGERPVGRRDPADQAKYWMAESDRVLQRHPDSASMHMGAAWMLDSPNFEFMWDPTQRVRPMPTVPGLELMEWRGEGAYDVTRPQMQKKYQMHCVALAARATKLDPDTRYLWRMRALLLFVVKTPRTEWSLEPRTEDWLEVLDECAAHDPENALYDYLAALALWQQSADSHWKRNKYVHNIVDEAGFALGTERFLRGQQREYLAFGEEGYSSITEFLGHCDLLKTEQSDAVRSRLVDSRRSVLLKSLRKWRRLRANTAGKGGNSEESLAIDRQNQRLTDQTLIPETPVPESLSTSEWTWENSDRTRLVVLWILSLMTGVSAAVLFCFGALLVGAAMLLARGNHERLRLGAVRQTIVWIMGCGTTFVVLGMAPARVISHKTQSRAIPFAAESGMLVLILLAGWFFIRWMRRRRFQFRLSTLLAMVTGVAVLSSLWPAFPVAYYWIVEHRSKICVPERGWHGTGAFWLQENLEYAIEPWTYAFMQWFFYHGLSLGIFVSLMLGTGWLMRRRARQAETSLIEYWISPVRTRWAALLHWLGGTAFVAASCLLLIYLCVAPRLVRQSEAWFQHQMHDYRVPLARHAEIREIQVAIRLPRELNEQHELP